MKKIIIFLNIFVFSLTCKHVPEHGSKPKAHPVDRKLMGAAVPLVNRMPLDPVHMKASMKFRRERAWDVLQGLLREVPVGEHLSDLAPASNQVPIWQTWYESSEFQWMFDDLYNRLGKDGRIQFTGNKAQLFEGLPDGYDFCPSDLQGIFERHSNLDISRQFTAERFSTRLKKFKTVEEIRGVSGNGITLFSPGLIFHYLQNYRQIFQCRDALAILDPKQKFSPARTPCLATEFPKGDQSLFANSKPRLKAECQPLVDTSRDTIGESVAVKTAWQLVGPNATLASFDSSAAAMDKNLETGAWNPIAQVPTTNLSSQNIYTIETVPKLDSGAKEKFQLSAIHFVTKDLDDWLWISLWWSQSPDTDFGADRPKTGAFAADSPWSNYKMCVVSSYDEGSPNPVGEFADSSLSQAAGATSQKTQPQTWCANPYIERGQGNTRTNCIGCHQHAGSPIFPDDVFLDIAGDPENARRRAQFPANGRQQVRENFPGEYLWSFDNAPDFFQSKIIRIIRDFKDEDAQD